METGIRGNYLARQWRIIKAVAAARQGITAARLSEQEEIELRTVYRDLQTLQDAGFPLYGKKDGRTTKWFLADPVKGKGVPAPFTMAELIALSLARDILAKLPDNSISQALSSLFVKFSSTLVHGSITKLNEIQDSISIISKSAQELSELEQKIDLVNQMVLAKKRLRVIYEENGEVMELLTDPYRTWYYGDQWYLMAHCHELKETRMLLIERIKQMRLIDEDSTPDPNFDLGDFLRRISEQVIADMFNIRIKVAPIWREWLGSASKAQEGGRINADGSMEVELSLGCAPRVTTSQADGDSPREYAPEAM